MPGITIAAIGLFLLVLGVNAWDSLPKDVGALIGHAPSRAAVVMTIAGAVVFLAGALFAIRRRRRETIS